MSAQAQGLLPAPPYSRSGDLVFVSSIHPVDGSGGIVQGDALSPYVGESDMAAQTRRALQVLDEALRDAGTTLDQTLRVEVHLVDAADFVEFKIVWTEVFGDDPPARTTVVVGDDHVLDGCRLNLHAVALAGDSSWTREVIHTDDAPDPMPAEHCPQAIKAGPFLFPSALPATDFEHGIPVGHRPRMPYYGSEAEMQAVYVFDNLQAVCKAAGTDLANSIKSQLYEVDLSTFHDVDGIWAQYMGVPPTRSSMAVRDLLVPGAIFVANLTILVPDETYKKVETREGLRWHPVDVRKVNFTPGIWADDWLFTAGQVSVPDYAAGEFVTAPAGLPHHYSDIEVQTEFVMQLLTEQLQANGLALSDVVDARVYLVHQRRDYRGFVRAWTRIWDGAGHRPSLSVVPSAQRDGRGGIMMEDLIIEIDLISRRS